MKRKIFSTLLFGALAFVSLSTVTSCKDYDDDINDLSAKQASMLAQIESLQSSVTSNASAITEVRGTATEAMNKAIAASADASAAQTAANNAITAAQTAGAAAATAQSTADAAAQAAQKALDAIGDNTKGLVKRVADLEGKIAGLDALQTELNNLKLEVAECATKEDLAKLQAKFDSLNGWFQSVFAMVTNVQLFGTFTGNAIDVPTAAKNITMMHGNVLYTSDFGDNEALANDLKTVFATATPAQNFVKDTDIKASAGLLLNVQPANADLTTSKLLIVNSKGEAMDDYLEVLTSEATRYDKIISTRGSSINTGLWSVPVQFKEGVDMKKFAAAIKTKVDGSDKDVLFAVAVNNTDTVKTYAGDNRYVLSTFDLTVASKPYERAGKLDFSVDENKIATIHNRWNGSQATTGSYEPQHVTSSTPKEYKWNNSTDEGCEAPNAAMKQKDGKLNFEVDASTDSRSTQKLLNAKVGVPMTVEMDETVSGKIAYYYVTLDENFAIESAPSELNSWHTYTISGLNTVVKGTDKLQITVSDLKNVKGDVIGFRLYAIDNDGTLVDPDGRAFYALVGEPEAKGTVDVTVHAENIVDGAAQSEPVALNAEFVSSLASVKAGVGETVYAKDGGLGENWAGGTIKEDPQARIHYQLGKINDNGDFERVQNWKDATHVVVRMAPVNAFQDGKTWTITANGSDGETLNPVVNVLTINVTKVMPTTIPADNGAVTWKTGQTTNEDQTHYICYVDPQKNITGSMAGANWTAAKVSTGYKDLAKAINNLNDDNFIIYIKNAVKENNAWTKDLSVNGSSKAYVAEIPVELIDNTTEHALNITYNYKNISYRPNDKGELTQETNFEVPVMTDKSIVFACVLDPTVQVYTWKEWSKTNADKTVTKWTNNYIVYDDNTFGETDKGEKLSGFTLCHELLGDNKYDNGFDGKHFTDLYAIDGYTAELVTAEGTNAGVAEYYDVKLSGATGFTFEKKSNATTPHGTVKSTLNVKAKDIFGHEKVIISLPFEVRRK